MHVLDVFVISLALYVCFIINGNGAMFMWNPSSRWPPLWQPDLLSIKTFVKAVTPAPPATLVNILGKNNLTNLLHLVEQANFYDTINGTGPMTFFAAKYAWHTRFRTRTKFQPEDWIQLLKYHVLTGIGLTQGDFDNDILYPTLAGEPIRLNMYKHDTLYTANGIEILELNKLAINGVLHIVKALLPKPELDIAELVQTDVHSSIMYELLLESGLMHILNSTDAVTLLVPHARAFSKLSENVTEQLRTDSLYRARVVQNHILSGTFFSAGFEEAMTVETMVGSILTISKKLWSRKMEPWNRHTGDTNSVDKTVRFKFGGDGRERSTGSRSLFLYDPAMHNTGSATSRSADNQLSRPAALRTCSAAEREHPVESRARPAATGH